MQNVPDFSAMLRQARRSAVHLELRDSYGIAGEVEEFAEFLRTGHVDTDPESEGWSGWVAQIREAVAGGGGGGRGGLGWGAGAHCEELATARRVESL
ncbi:DUF6879 family protein, partial [Kitasatospora sp. NPDC059803]|uniref:DUF6879 family protein n=1 Tax=Kitasatospora sp. NPDC059803 TaxID=3346953 RepID=UPI0036667B02